MTEFRNNITEVTSTAAEDWKQASWIDRAKFAGTSTLLAMHEFGMETAVIATAGLAAEHSGNNPIIMGAAAGLLSLATEMTLTHGVSSSLQSFEPTMDQVRDRYFGNAAYIDKEVPNRIDNIRNAVDVGSMALTLGSPGIILRDYTRHPEKSHDELVGTGRRAAFGLAAFNAMWPPVLTGAGVVLDKVGVTTGNNVAVEVIQSPYTLGAVLATFVGMRISNAVTGRRRRKEALELEAKQTDQDTE